MQETSLLIVFAKIQIQKPHLLRLLRFNVLFYNI